VKGRAGSPNLPGFDGKRKAGEGADGNEGSEAMHAKEGPEADWGMETIENDPLGLVRREIAVMKKLE